MDVPSAPTAPIYAPTPPDLAAARAAVHANGQQLSRWLNITRIFMVVSCALFGVLVPISAAWLLRTTGGFGAVELLMLSVVAALMVVQGALVWWVLGWTREYLNRVRAWALGQGVDRARIDALRRTLGTWIAFAQWAGLLLMVLMLILVPVAMSFDPDSRGEDSGVMLIVWALVGLTTYVPAIVINWLVLASIRRWMDTLTDRALNRSDAPVTPGANLVSTWFIVLMVLLGLSALSALPALLIVPVMPLALQDTAMPSATTVVTVVLAGTLLLSFAWYALLFMLLLWSRAFALGTATIADAPAPAARRVDLQKPI